MEQVTVTGGAGFIGSSIIRLLIKDGYDVVVLDDLSTGYKSNIAGLDNVRLEIGDIRNEDAVAKALQGSSGVFHLAAHVGNVRSIENPKFDSEVNVLGTLNVLEQMKKQGIEKLVYSSSAAIYGETIIMPVAEDHPVEPDSLYGVSKLAGEKHALCYGRLYNWAVMCLRYFNAYGIRQRFDAYGNVIPIFAERLAKNQDLTIYGDGTQTRDFINVKDIAQANLKAYKSGKYGAYNIATGASTKIIDLANMMISLDGNKGKIVNAPARKGEVMHSLADLNRAEAELSYHAKVNLEEGLGSYLEWYKQDNA
jgi:UDP-glucose 4-epimerase